MAELELQQVKCPSCKRVISSFSPFQAEVECPYCHNKAFNPLITAKKVPVPDLIVPISFSEDYFKKEMIKELIETDFVPTNIFEHITTDRIVKVYLPMYLFNGRQATHYCWHFKIETGNGKIEKDEDGELSGYFSFMSLAYDGDEIPKELADFARYIDAPLSTKKYDPELLGLTGRGDDPITLPLNNDKEIVWHKHAIKQLAKKVNKSIKRERRPDGEIVSCHIDDPAISCQSSRYILFPCWFTTYSYKDKKYWFIIDGTGRKKYITNPVNKKLRLLVKVTEILGKVLPSLAVIGAVGALFQGEFAAAFIGGPVWFFGTRYGAKFANKAVLQATKKHRETNAKRLLNE